MNWYALTAAMVGSGFGYSLVMGYGIVHGLGMAAAYLFIGAVLWIASTAISRVVDVSENQTNQ